MKTINESMAKLAINKSLLKEYTNSSNERIVYMNDNTEFQIQIFNPNTYTIGVSFAFNEKNTSSWNYGDNLLVIKPGQRIWLERYLNSENKLLFSTYEVGTSKAVQEAIKANGILTLKFYKEKEQPKVEHININHQPITKWYNDYNNNIYYNNYGNSVCDKINNHNDYNNFNANTALSSCVNYVNSITTDSASEATFTSTSTTTSATYDATLKPKSFNKSRSMETGRIDKGGYSSQKFNTVYMDFESYPFTTETIHILPMSQKPVTSSDLQKLYCPNCGRKLNQKYKFCPYCGTKIKNCPNNENYVIEKCHYCGRRIRSNMMECPHCGEILR